MEYAVVVHKDGKVEKIIGPFPTKAAAQAWADKHVVKGNNWATAEYIEPPPEAPAKPAAMPAPTTD